MPQFAIVADGWLLTLFSVLALLFLWPMFVGCPNFLVSVQMLPKAPRIPTTRILKILRVCHVYCEPTTNNARINFYVFFFVLFLKTRFLRSRREKLHFFQFQNGGAGEFDSQASAFLSRYTNSGPFISQLQYFFRSRSLFLSLSSSLRSTIEIGVMHSTSTGISFSGFPPHLPLWTP